MNLLELIQFSADFMSPGAAQAPSFRHHGVISRHMKKLKGLTRHTIGHHTSEHIKADASPSDMASHHLWQEPSSTDVTINQWRSKRVLEKQMRRNMDPFEADAERVIRAGRCRCKGSARR